MSQKGAQILVVEDEESIGQGLCDVLTFRGHQVTWAKDGASALEYLERGNFDLTLLDIMLPEVDGYSVCRKAREAGVRCGIVMLTAKGSEEDILQGFEAGADDYVTKPFSLAQLLARVDAVLGRSRREPEAVLEFGQLRVETERGVMTGDRGESALTAREIGILTQLLESPGRIVSRRTLLRNVWEMKNPEGVETRTVDVHIAKLRKKLTQVSAQVIETVRGQGYRIVTGARQ